jgi:hypothetical protein
LTSVAPQVGRDPDQLAWFKHVLLALDALQHQLVHPESRHPQLPAQRQEALGGVRIQPRAPDS